MTDLSMQKKKKKRNPPGPLRSLLVYQTNKFWNRKISTRIGICGVSEQEKGLRNLDRQYHRRHTPVQHLQTPVRRYLIDPWTFFLFIFRSYARYRGASCSNGASRGQGDGFSCSRGIFGVGLGLGRREE